MHIKGARHFPNWAAQCRSLLAQGLTPESLYWTDADAPTDAPDDLFADVAPVAAAPPTRTYTVPRAFQDLARVVLHHRDPQRFHLLYAALWRITRGDRHLLAKVTDPVTHALLMMQKQVSRDAHKMKAFVRFRVVRRNHQDWYVAWYEPDHVIVRYTAPFFRDRFETMNWSILTPDECVHWNGEGLTFTPGVPHDPHIEDAAEDLWRTYYASIFNPARLKIAAMKNEMPVRFWKNLPEAALIPELVSSSGEQTAAMIDSQSLSALHFLPKNPTIETLREAANHCRGCPVYHGTTQAVCSHGPSHAQIVLVGEQPGHEEDLQGVPFIGPAGQVLDRALRDAELPRKSLYITEAVKHFKHETRSGRRYHRTPSNSDVAACRPWLLEEMKIVRPRVLVCLGSSAAHSVLGRQVTLGQVFDQIIATPLCSQTLVTNHPAAVLRQPDPAKSEATYAQLVRTLRQAATLARTPQPASPTA